MMLDWETVYVLGSAFCVLVFLLAFSIVFFATIEGVFLAVRGRQTAGAWRNVRLALLVVALATATFFWIDTLDTAHFYWNLLGRVVLLEGDVDGYDSERHFNGDGFSHHRIGLPARVCSAIRVDPGSLAGRPPARKEANKLSEVVSATWTPTPLDASTLASFEGMYYDGIPGQDPDLPTLTDRAEASLRTPGSFAAWDLRIFSHQETRYVSDLNLYILDLPACELVMINHNT